jgi:hypothetical protein
MTGPFLYRWRVKTRHPERFGQPCHVLIRGPMNSCLVEFADGFKTVTSRWYVRRLAPPLSPVQPPPPVSGSAP